MFGSKDREIARLKQALARMEEQRDDAQSDRDAAIAVSRSAEAWAQEAVDLAEQLSLRERELADCRDDSARLRAEHADTVRDLVEAHREVRDLELLLKQAVHADRVVLPAADPGEVERLRRQVRECQGRELALQARLDERRQLSGAAAARHGLEVAR